MTNLAPTFGTKAFTYDKATRCFVGEISELTAGGRLPLLGQIYPDACDAGMILISCDTGKEVRFYLIEEKRDADGDLVVMILKPLPEEVQKNPLLEGLSIHALND
jgi:hypothetical protein